MTCGNGMQRTYRAGRLRLCDPRTDLLHRMTSQGGLGGKYRRGAAINQMKRPHNLG
jgi:hypothetical protein